MIEPGRAAFVLILAALLAGSVAAATASSGTVTVFNSDGRGGGLGVFGSSGSDDVRVSLSGGTYTISGGSSLQSDSCSRSAEEALECPRHSSRFIASLRGGNDTLRVAGEATGRLLRGGEGADTLIGGPATNAMSGDSEADVLFGRGGNDRLYGAGGRDEISGGRGDDLVDAVDGRRDVVLRCGPGDDVAIVDRGLDPAATGCERVKQR